MTAPAAAGRSNIRRFVWLSVAAGVLVFALANAHLVYVAFSSAPDCVPHTMEIGADKGAAPFRAAKSAC